MIIAAYNGKCSCGKPIDEGDLIGLVDGEWVCEECAGENGEDSGADD